MTQICIMVFLRPWFQYQSELAIQPMQYASQNLGIAASTLLHVHLWTSQHSQLWLYSGASLYQKSLPEFKLMKICRNCTSQYLDLLVYKFSLFDFTSVSVNTIQQNLSAKDTLGLAVLSSVERLSYSRRLQMNYCNGKGVQKGSLCWEAVPFSEVPL